ncbi:hypothetical protein [Mesorhizobium retamae]|uniref:Uncharacterized protein n=1 Tax=Mesorhizobium retamae TaxID=2912854 RepID=A0ABS9Q965_9HYPH|nr:hypothetical protein [Mesorhizobium sp. IRAMC:0171]MCG7503948.1 hypothetical protein [Mesorhizobium sp. IRAMC:0171]
MKPAITVWGTGHTGSAAGRSAADGETLSSLSPHYSAFQHLVELMEVRNIDRAVAEGYDAIFRRAIAAGHLHDVSRRCHSLWERSDKCP